MLPSREGQSGFQRHRSRRLRPLTRCRSGARSVFSSIRTESSRIWLATNLPAGPIITSSPDLPRYDAAGDYRQQPAERRCRGQCERAGDDSVQRADQRDLGHQRRSDYPERSGGAGRFSFQNNDTQLIFTPATRTYSGPGDGGNHPGLTDYAGNVISNAVTFTFTVDTPAATTSRPFVSLANPPNNITGVGRNVTLQAEFNARVNQLTVNSTSFVVADSNSGLLPVP